MSLRSSPPFTSDASARAGAAPLLGILGLVSDAALLLDAQGVIVHANDRAAALLGRDADALVGRLAWDELPDEPAATLRRLHRRALEHGRPVEEPLRLGTRRPLEARLVPADGGVVAVLVDVGQRDLALVFDAVHEAVLIMDESFRIVDWNAAAEEIFGYARAEAVGRTPEFFHHPAYEGRREEEIRAELTARGRWAGEVRFLAKDGREGVVDVVVAEHRDEHDVLLGYVGVNRDKTEHVRAEAALRASEERLREAQKMEAVGRLAGGVAHDFNNILTVITSYAELLSASFDARDPRLSDVDEVLKATARAAGLTRQLMTVGRRQRIEPAVLDFGRRVREYAPTLRQVAGESVFLEFRVSEGCLVRFDPRQLEQIVANLVANARDAMLDGMALIEVRPATVGPDLTPLSAWADPSPDTDIVGLVEPGDYVVLRVTDAGPGMSAEVRSRIFEPFFSTKGLGQGRGLGLPTVYATTTQAGGHLRVRSAPGEGTSIDVWLPRVVSGEPRVSTGVRALNSDAAGAGELVLIAEDESAVRISVRRMLEHAGYRVLDARNGAEALRLWREHRDEVALVLSDVMMPELGGIGLAVALRAEDPDVRILFMSGYTGEGDDGEAMPLSAPLLAKPFESGELLSAVKDSLTA